MNTPSSEEMEALWAHHHAQWRDPTQIVSQWQETIATNPKLLCYSVHGAWWETLAACGITLLVTREYEHLIMAMGVTDEGPTISYMRLPHPSGLVVNREHNLVYIASTRNPNQVYDLQPVSSYLTRLDTSNKALLGCPLIPVRSRFYPGCLYIHDLALINGDLYANAVGQNAVVHLYDKMGYKQMWWPRCIETETGPLFGQNHLQLNSIAAGTTLTSSYFSASTDKPSSRRPGHKNFPVDKRGVIFSGETREPIVRGLTRPHSARLHQDRIWVDNSGYGEFGFVDNNSLVVVTKFPGWTRGLAFYKDIAFVGSSRVIPRFRQYAPGLEVDTSICGIHAVNIKSGHVVGSLIWPYGNQIFALDWISSKLTSGFPITVGTKRATTREKMFFFTFKISGENQ